MRYVVFTQLFFLIAWVDAFGQREPAAVELRIVKSQYEKVNLSNHQLGNFQKIVFRLINRSAAPVQVFGEPAEDGSVDVENDILAFSEVEKGWRFYFGGETSTQLENAKEGPWSLLRPGQSFDFERRLAFSCLGGRYKMVVFVRSPKATDFRAIFSDEILLKGPPEKC